MSKYVIRWRDDKGEAQHKFYDDWDTAKKAKKWLEERGATEVDIAVRIGVKDDDAE